MNRSIWLSRSLMLLLLTVGLIACSTPAAPSPTAAPATELPAAPGDELPAAAGTGVLQFRANGEDFIRQGFTTKDGWAINFDHVYVTLADITAYQTDPPYDAEAGGDLQATTTAPLSGTHTVDLAAGDEDAEPILIGEVSDAPAGRYNALAWDVVAAETGPASGASIMLQGEATQADETIVFTLRLTNTTSHTCGDYIGDERKGILEAGGTADMEATFHFDHMFGDADLPMDDSLNADALGFAPLADLANEGVLDVDMATLATGLSPEDYAKLAHVHLAHVGEGHCTGDTHAP
jgi:hypothetical protein